MLELIQNHKMDVMFMAETWHDPESISISKLRSRGLVVFEKARPRLSESVNTLLTNHERVAVAFNSMFRGMLLKLTSTASFEHLCVRKSSSSEESSDWFFIAQVLLIHCFTMNLKTPWVFWPHTRKRF